MSPANPQVLPLNADQNQSLQAPLSIDGATTPLNLFLHFNSVAGYWVISISDTGGNLLLSGVPLIAGNAPAGNLLGQFAHLGIGSLYMLNVSGDASQQVPNAANLGKDFILVWDNTPPA